MNCNEGLCMINELYVPATDTNELALRWLRRARESQFGHYEMGIINDGRNKYFGIPVIIVTSIVSASVFSAIQKDGGEVIKFIAMGLSLLAVVLSSLQTFFNFSERAEKHRAAGAEYASLRRRLELFSASSVKDIEALRKIGDDLSALGARAPTIPASVYEKIKALG